MSDASSVYCYSLTTHSTTDFSYSSLYSVLHYSLPPLLVSSVANLGTPCLGGWNGGIGPTAACDIPTLANHIFSASLIAVSDPKQPSTDFQTPGLGPWGFTIR